ncbi:MAG TPA: SRPBCC domain-containing protein [Mycobacteriales bacterium]|nr:SRPBCC domain-containing protein [Mycobacteriales bacterium]
MKENLMHEATLISTGDKPVLRFERFLPRPVEQVWRAVTDLIEMQAWFPTRIEIDRWETGATLTHHFDGQPYDPLPGTVIECSEPHRLVFTWGEDTISFELSAVEGGTTFVLTEQLGASKAARNAAGWEVCLERLVDGVVGEDWTPRFERYSATFEPLLGPQEGPPTGSHG